MTNHPPVLIEHWLPIEAIGVESRREHAYGTPFPAPNRLHVWWARRPLITSRAAILGGVLPQWSPDFPEELRAKFPNEATYRGWVLLFLGIRGDPGAGQKLLNSAKMRGEFIKSPFASIPRAFSISPSAEDLQTMGDLLEWTWGTRELSVLDPFTGGGSIPFEALRYGFTTIANDLNPVASVIQKATLDYPARFGVSLADDIRKWGKRWYELVKPKLQLYYTPLPLDTEGVAYLWARTVACPTTGKTVPLSPNWWLSTGSNPIAVKMIADEGMDAPRFEIVTGAKAKSAKPDEGTIARGVARSPWTGETIDGNYIKAEAQAGRMGQILYAIAAKKRGGFEFRAPTQADLDAITRAESELAKKKPVWEAKGLFVNEPIPEGNKTSEPHRYGEHFWYETFAPRQIFAMTVFLETLAQVREEIKQQVEPAKQLAIET